MSAIDSFAVPATLKNRVKTQSPHSSACFCPVVYRRAAVIPLAGAVHPTIASAAKQSSRSWTKVDCFVAPLLAKTTFEALLQGEGSGSANPRQGQAVADRQHADVDALVVAQLEIEDAQRLGVGVLLLRIGHRAAPQH